jgi:hypothetical protein
MDSAISEYYGQYNANKTVYKKVPVPIPYLQQLADVLVAKHLHRGDFQSNKSSYSHQYIKEK